MDDLATWEALRSFAPTIGSKSKRSHKRTGLALYELIPLLRYMGLQAKLSGTIDNIRTIH